MEHSSDMIVFWQYGLFHINLTIVETWGVILFLVLGARWVGKRMTSDIHISKWQGLLEMLVIGIKEQIEEAGVQKSEKFIGFLGTLFLFLTATNLFCILPGYRVPTGLLSTTAALACAVFLSVIFFGIREQGVKGYFREYLQPVALMLPFHIVSEISRTIALSIRLFGNMMSGELIVSILLTVTPFFIPAVMTGFGLLIGMIQAFIFTVLATVYIAAATQIHEKKGEQHG